MRIFLKDIAIGMLFVFFVLLAMALASCGPREETPEEKIIACMGDIKKMAKDRGCEYVESACVFDTPTTIRCDYEMKCDGKVVNARHYCWEVYVDDSQT